MHKAKFPAIAVMLFMVMVMPAVGDQLELGMSLTPIAPEENLSIQ